MAAPFSLASIHLHDGPFAKARDLTADYLLSLDPDRLLAGFLINSGLEPQGEIYGGWEAMGLAGHSIGHYLTAVSQEFSRSKDPRFLQKADAIVQGLARCQEARGDGFLSAFRYPDGFDRARLDQTWLDISQGKLQSAGFDLNGMWAPWYVHHKILVGLMDTYRLCGLDLGLQTARKFADWALEITKGLDDEQWQTMLHCEYGGMNEALADLYGLTHESKYLSLARKFYDHKVLDALKSWEDELAAKHANTQIPKVLGLARLYELEGHEEDKNSALFFWDRVVYHHSYVIGGNSNGEYFGPAGQLSSRLSSNTCETCNTYNMLRLTQKLFAWQPSAALADFYERAFFNHILASQHPDKGGYTYFVPLVSGGSRSFSSPHNDFTCCHGTGMETHSKHGEFAYSLSGSDKLWVNLFVTSRLVWEEAGITLSQTTSQLAGGSVELVIEEGEAEFELLIRHPWWHKGNLVIEVQGSTVAQSDQPSSYVSIHRRWQKGDKISFELPLELHEEPTPDNPEKAALMYGPLVLAADLGSPDEPEPWSPVLIKQSGDLAAWITQEDAAVGHFTVTDAAKPNALKLRPFFDHPDNRTAVYFDKFSPTEWQQKEAEYRAAEEEARLLKERTIDHCTLGEMQPERDHDLTCEKNDVREVNGRGIRTPLTKGWMEINLKVDNSVNNKLVLNLWGNDRLEACFALLIDGVEISQHDLTDRPLNTFFNLEVFVPSELIKGKDSVRLRLESREERPGPTLAGISVVRS